LPEFSFFTEVEDDGGRSFFNPDYEGATISEKQITESLTRFAKGDINVVFCRKSMNRLLGDIVFLDDDKFADL